MRTKIAEFSEFETIERKVVSVDGVEIGVFRVDGGLIGWMNECPHQGGPVCQGRLFKPVVEVLDDMQRSLGRAHQEGDMNVVCPWHGMEFDLRTGKFKGNQDMSLRPAVVDVVDGGVYVTI